MKWNQGLEMITHLVSNIIKSKVSSSIAHLYQRPRVWLEGFIPAGGRPSGADVADAVFQPGLGHNSAFAGMVLIIQHMEVLWNGRRPVIITLYALSSQMGSLLRYQASGAMCFPLRVSTDVMRL